MKSILTCLLCFVLSSAHGGWVTIKNSRDEDLRLCNIFIYKNNKFKEHFLLFLGGLPKGSTIAIRFEEQNDVIHIGGLAGISEKGVRHFQFDFPQKKDEMRIYSELNGWDHFILTKSWEMERDRHFSPDDMSRLTIVDCIPGVELLNPAFYAEDQLVNGLSSPEEERAHLKLLKGNMPRINAPPEINDARLWSCYLDGWRNGWYSSLISNLEELPLSMSFLSNLHSRYADDAMPKELLDQWMYKGFVEGRKQGMLLLGKEQKKRQPISVPDFFEGDKAKTEDRDKK